MPLKSMLLMLAVATKEVWQKTIDSITEENTRLKIENMALKGENKALTEKNLQNISDNS